VILPGVLALPPLAVMLVVQPRNGLSQRLDTGRRTVLSPMTCNVYRLRPLEAALNLVVDLRRTLAEVGPGVGVLEVAVLVGAL
jgi:hypothetical protein